MKTENNQQNKAAFMAQYWGQAVMSIPNRYNLSKMFKIGYTYMKTESVQLGHLKLTPLDQITDEDALFLAGVFGNPERYSDYVNIRWVKEWLNDYTSISSIRHKWECLKAFDYLRSKGYAIPWRDLSVADLVSYGWVKLKEG